MDSPPTFWIIPSWVSFEGWHTVGVTAVILTLIVGLSAAWIIYAIYLHPLRSFPGPKLWAITQFPWHYRNLKGQLVYALQDLHERYGPVVRIGPNELSYAADDIGVWRSICNRRPEMPRAMNGTGIVGPGVTNLALCDAQTHARLRKAINPAFTDRALREHEVVVSAYITKLVDLLHRRCSEGPQDLMSLLTWTAFDVTGDLAFGESFNCLEETRWHPWVSSVFEHVSSMAFAQFATYYRLMSLILFLLPKHVREAQEEFNRFTEEKAERRLKRSETRKDFISFFLTTVEDKDAYVSRQEIYIMAQFFIVAGSETSATSQIGTFYFLLSNPEALKKLVREIRSTYKSASEIDVSSASQLEYLTCVIRESLRMYPPTPATAPRVVPEPGELIRDEWVPAGTVVGINHWCTNHSRKSFHEPKLFAPERWLAEGKRPERYNDDRRTVVQPFSYGSRNCAGTNLAYMELRLILCRLLFEFDMELCEVSQNWTDQRSSYLWDKPALMVMVKPRQT